MEIASIDLQRREIIIPTKNNFLSLNMKDMNQIQTIYQKLEIMEFLMSEYPFESEEEAYQLTDDILALTDSMSMDEAIESYMHDKANEDMDYEGD